MVIKHRHYFKTIFVLLQVALTVVFQGCGDENSKQNTVDASRLDLEASNLLTQSEFSFMDSISTKARVRSNRARVFNEKQETILDTNVLVRFFNIDGSISAMLNCDLVRVDNRTNNMYASGHVVVISDVNHTRVETNSMMWDNLKRKLYSTEYVRVSKPNEVIEGGVGFESDESMSNYRIFKVSGVKQQ